MISTSVGIGFGNLGHGELTFAYNPLDVDFCFPLKGNKLLWYQVVVRGHDFKSLYRHQTVTI